MKTVFSFLLFGFAVFVYLFGNGLLAMQADDGQSLTTSYWAAQLVLNFLLAICVFCGGFAWRFYKKGRRAAALKLLWIPGAAAVMLVLTAIAAPFFIKSASQPANTSAAAPK